jgi:hypothetical protein
MTDHTHADPSTICIQHKAVETNIKTLFSKQKKSEEKIDGIQKSITDLRVSHAKVVGIGTAALAALQIILKYLV